MGASPTITKSPTAKASVLDQYQDVEATLALLLDGLVGISDRVACVQTVFSEARTDAPGSAEDYARRNQTSKSNLYRMQQTATRRWADLAERSVDHLQPWQTIRNLVEQTGGTGLSTDALVEASGLPEDVALETLAALLKSGDVVRQGGLLRAGRTLAIASRREARRNLGLYLQGSLARVVRKRLAAGEDCKPYTDGSAMGQGQRTVARELVPELQRRIHEAVREIADEFEHISSGLNNRVRFQHIVATHILDVSPVDQEGRQ